MRAAMCYHRHPSIQHSQIPMLPLLSAFGLQLNVTKFVVEEVRTRLKGGLGTLAAMIRTKLLKGLKPT